mmetsp:Transcript_20336/g.28174  ORF Transcript_20336/g.28174 Transcript_20336/m.28174 type:complete len:205 (-) Transcript_20336:610-1224(-)
MLNQVGASDDVQGVRHPVLSDHVLHGVLPVVAHEDVVESVRVDSSPGVAVLLAGQDGHSIPRDELLSVVVEPDEVALVHHQVHKPEGGHVPVVQRGGQVPGMVRLDVPHVVGHSHRHRLLLGVDVGVELLVGARHVAKGVRIGTKGGKADEGIQRAEWFPWRPYASAVRQKSVDMRFIENCPVVYFGPHLVNHKLSKLQELFSC